MSQLYYVGQREARPWGEWEILELGEGFARKRLMVLPKARLSLQLHHHRSETWTCLNGQAIAQIGTETRHLLKGSICHIPELTSHRLYNNSSKLLVIEELQHGLYLSEQDIVRLQDDYGRLAHQQKRNIPYQSATMLL